MINICPPSQCITGQGESAVDGSPVQQLLLAVDAMKQDSTDACGV